MVHPTGLIGKTTHSLSAIQKALVNLLEREYNKDAGYRDPEMPPLKRVYYGEPAVILGVPCAGVEFSSVTFTDAPQDAGAEVTAEIKIHLYGHEQTPEAQQGEAIKMAETVRHILIDNKTLPDADGTENVYQIGYLTMSFSFDSLLGNFNGQEIGVDIATITATTVWSELGY